MILAIIATIDMRRHESKWTSIYWDISKDPENPGFKPYVRLTPAHVALESHGFPHGLSLGGGAMFETEELAINFAQRVDAMMEEQLEGLKEAALEKLTEQPPLLGNWHHGNGEICNGSLRVATASIDTNPTDSVRDEILEWMCNTLNAPKLTKEAFLDQIEFLIMSWSNMPPSNHRPLINFIRRNINEHKQSDPDI